MSTDYLHPNLNEMTSNCAPFGIKMSSKRSPDTKCCFSKVSLCSRRLRGKDQYSISQKSLREKFKDYVADMKVFDVKGDKLCGKCRAKVMNPNSMRITRTTELSMDLPPLRDRVPTRAFHPENETVGMDAVAQDIQDAACNDETSFVFAENYQEMQIETEEPLNIDAQEPIQFQMSSSVEISVNVSEGSLTSKGSSLASKTSGTRFNGIQAATKTERKCVVCGDSKGRARVSQKARMQIWLNRDIYIYENSRSCKSHMSGGVFNQIAIAQIKSSKGHVQLSKEKMVDWVLKVSTRAKQKKQLIDFDEDSVLEDADYVILLGHTKEQFKVIFSYCKDEMKKSSNRSPRNALAMFMMKLTRNFSQTMLAFLFGIKNRARVSDVIHRVSEILDKHLVPFHLGYKNTHLSREDAIQNHGLPFTSKVLNVPENVIHLVADGTYCYIQKPSDTDRQLATYCAFKKRPVIKMMMNVFMDGHILSADGPFNSDYDSNDAKILNCLFLDNDSLGGFLHADDVLILDRGFRDSINIAESRGLITFMPKLLQLSTNKKQFATEDANYSRKVTLLRFVVEAVNGRVKNKFSFFQETIAAPYVPKVGCFFRISCALTNLFCPPILKPRAEDGNIVDAIVKRSDSINELQIRIETERLELKRSVWVEVNQHALQDFPRLTEEEIRKITLGIYQPKLAKDYVIKHMDDTFEYNVFYHKHEEGLVRVKIESRYFRRKEHQLWIKYLPNENGVDGIVSYYCKCAHGARTLGTCAHITSVIWYLGLQRHRGTPILKRRAVWNCIDAAKAIREHEERAAAQDTEGTTLQDTQVSSVLDAQTPSLQDRQASSLQNTPASSLLDTQASSFQDTQTSSLQDTQASSLQDTQASSVQDTEASSTQATQETPASSTQDMSNQLSTPGHVERHSNDSSQCSELLSV